MLFGSVITTVPFDGLFEIVNVPEEGIPESLLKISTTTDVSSSVDVVSSIASRPIKDAEYSSDIHKLLS